MLKLKASKRHLIVRTLHQLNHGTEKWYSGMIDTPQIRLGSFNIGIVTAITISKPITANALTTTDMNLLDRTAPTLPEIKRVAN